MDDKKAFVTGSRAYGLPRDDSDVDLVVYVSAADYERLCQAAMDYGDKRSLNDEYTRNGVCCLKFGNLNLLVQTQDRTYNIWKKGTKALKRQKPVNRDFAIEFFRKLRSEKDGE